MEPFVSVDHVEIVSVMGKEILAVQPNGTVVWRYQPIERDDLVALVAAAVVVLEQAGVVSPQNSARIIADLITDQTDDPISIVEAIVAKPDEETAPDDMPY